MTFSLGSLTTADTTEKVWYRVKTDPLVFSGSAGSGGGGVVTAPINLPPYGDPPPGSQRIVFDRPQSGSRNIDPRLRLYPNTATFERTPHDRLAEHSRQCAASLDSRRCVGRDPVQPADGRRQRLLGRLRRGDVGQDANALAEVGRQRPPTSAPCGVSKWHRPRRLRARSAPWRGRSMPLPPRRACRWFSAGPTVKISFHGSLRGRLEGDGAPTGTTSAGARQWRRRDPRSRRARTAISL